MAEAAFRPPVFKLSEGDNPCPIWRDYKDEIETYLLAAGLDDAGDERKIAILLYGLGQKYRKIFNSLDMTDVQRKVFKTVLEKFDSHFEPKKLTKLYMKKFDSCTQNPNESVGDYISKLKDLAGHCDFGTTLHMQLCKQISCGVRSEKLRVSGPVDVCGVVDSIQKDSVLHMDKIVENVKILEKPLHQVPLRLQKMRMRLQDYDFKLIAKRGTEIPVADALSRQFIKDSETALQKCKETNSDPYLALLNIRNTPRNSEIGSPAQRLFSRRTQTNLPVSSEKLKVQVQDPVKHLQEERQKKAKKYFDVHTKPLKPLEGKETVRVRNLQKKIWEPASLLGPTETRPRSYKIILPSGRQTFRNRRYIY